MTNIIVFTNPDNVEWVQIDNGDGNFTSMPKAVYDTLAANSATPQA